MQNGPLCLRGMSDWGSRRYFTEGLLSAGPKRLEDDRPNDRRVRHSPPLTSDMPTPNLLVVTNTSHWKLSLEGVEVISARTYLSPDTVQRYPGARVFNLCRSYSYQSLGYYVSLLAEARGHRAIPSVGPLRDFRSRSHRSFPGG